MALHVNSREELRDLLDSDRAEKLAPKASKAPARTKSEPAKRGNVLVKQSHQGLHVIPLRIFVAILAYLFMGTGWLIGAIGDAIYEIGKWMHDDKWNIT